MAVLWKMQLQLMNYKDKSFVAYIKWFAHAEKEFFWFWLDRRRITSKFENALQFHILTKSDSGIHSKQISNSSALCSVSAQNNISSNHPNQNKTVNSFDCSICFE